MFVTGSNVKSNQLPWVTILLLIANVGVFFKSYALEIQATHEWQQSGGWVTTMNGGDPSDLQSVSALEKFYQEWGFSLEDIVERGDVLSLFTHMFTHGGLAHLFGNMLMLWAFGSAMESTLKSGMYIVFYMTCGILAGLAQGAFAYGSDIPCVGASGAIAGLMGGFFVLFGMRAQLKMFMFIGGLPISFQVNALAYGGFWIFSQLISLTDADPAAGGVAWMAHIGGCVAGALFIAAIKSDMSIDLVDDSSGDLNVQHDSDKPEVTEVQLLEQVLDMNPLGSVITEFLGDDAIVPCSKCTGALDTSNDMGGRLLRCSVCGEITYVDGDLLLQSRDAQRESVTS